MRVLQVLWLLSGLALVSVGLAGCSDSGSSSGPQVGGESHFLSPCDAQRDCAEGLVCACGACTRPCDGMDTCGGEDLSVCYDAATASCGTPEPVCLPVCQGDDQQPCVADGELRMPGMGPIDERRQDLQVEQVPAALTADPPVEGTHLMGLPAVDDQVFQLVLLVPDQSGSHERYLGLIDALSRWGMPALAVAHDAARCVEADTCDDEALQHIVFGDAMEVDDKWVPDNNALKTRTQNLLVYAAEHANAQWGPLLGESWDFTDKPLVVMADGNGCLAGSALARHIEMQQVFMVCAPEVRDEIQAALESAHTSTPLERWRFYSPDEPEGRLDVFEEGLDPRWREWLTP